MACHRTSVYTHFCTKQLVAKQIIFIQYFIGHVDVSVDNTRLIMKKVSKGVVLCKVTKWITLLITVKQGQPLENPVKSHRLLQHKLIVVAFAE